MRLVATNWSNTKFPYDDAVFGFLATAPIHDVPRNVHTQVVTRAIVNCDPEWLRVVKWCLQYEMQSRPLPGAVLSYMQEWTQMGESGDITWLPNTPPPAPGTDWEIKTRPEVRSQLL